MKILFSVLLFFLPLFSLAQKNPHEEQYKNEIVYIPWKQYNPTSNCNPSFYWSVTRGRVPNQKGEFLYKMYFQSNSLYCNGSWAGTYMNGVRVYVNEIMQNPYSPQWVMFKEIYQPTGPFVFWAYPNPYVRFTWELLIVN